MMMNAAAANSNDPVAAALEILNEARRRADRKDDVRGTAGIAALGIAIVGSFIAIAAIITSPATIPMWCAAHGGCP